MCGKNSSSDLEKCLHLVTVTWTQRNKCGHWNHLRVCRHSCHQTDPRSRRGCDRMVVGFTTIPMQSVPITTAVVSSNLDQGEVYNIK